MLGLAIMAFAAATITAAFDAKRARVGIYIYENLESAHTPSSASGTKLASLLSPHFAQVLAADKVPLESNESVRILDALTKDRKVVIATVHTWLAGNVVAAPSITIADDAIKFQDLTWHVDHQAAITDAARAGCTQILIGTATGLVKEAGNRSAQSGSRLFSVTVMADFQLIDIQKSSTIWAQHYRLVNAAFDPRVGFDDGLIQVAEMAAKEIQSKVLENY